MPLAAGSGHTPHRPTHLHNWPTEFPVFWNLTWASLSLLQKVQHLRKSQPSTSHNQMLATPNHEQEHQNTQNSLWHYLETVFWLVLWSLARKNLTINQLFEILESSSRTRWPAQHFWFLITIAAMLTVLALVKTPVSGIWLSHFRPRIYLRQCWWNISSCFIWHWHKVQVPKA